MDDIHANPVGIILKDIYIIKNTINDKVYIGQAKSSRRRFLEHCQLKDKKRNISVIDQAIEKYGKENFYFEILESQIKDYNEKEKYYIKLYNSISPNGYNIQEGGEEPPVRNGFDNNQCRFTPNDIEEIKYLLTTFISIKDIAKKFGVSINAISRINTGKTYFDKNLDYPIRKNQISGEYENMLTSEQIDMVIEKIKTTNDSFSQIAMNLNVGINQVIAVNYGSYKAYRKKDEVYPIRESYKITEQHVNEIIKLLQQSTMTGSNIAKILGTSEAIVNGINRGDLHKKENLSYPIRDNRWHLSEEIFEEIRKMLFEQKSNDEIVEKLSVSPILIADINAGKSHKSAKYTYPIRNKKRILTDEQVAEIINNIINTTDPYEQIGRRFGVSETVVLNIKNGIKKYKRDGYIYPLRPSK